MGTYEISYYRDAGRWAYEGDNSSWLMELDKRYEASAGLDGHKDCGIFHGYEDACNKKVGECHYQGDECLKISRQPPRLAPVPEDPDPAAAAAAAAAAKAEKKLLKNKEKLERRAARRAAGKDLLLVEDV